MKRVWTSQEFQRLILKSQGLTQKFPFGPGKNAVLRTLEHLAYIQIDALSVVERAHHHTLGRLPLFLSILLNYTIGNL